MQSAMFEAPTVTSAWLGEHPRLRRAIAAAQPTLLGQAASSSSLLLLGIVSVSEARRNLIRCTWAKLFVPLPMRLLFVLGKNASDSHYSDVLLTPVEERLLMASSNRATTRRASGATYSSLSSFLKVYHFLRFAASAPEPLIGLGDDDVFIQPRMLLAQ